jgi:TIR domain
MAHVFFFSYAHTNKDKELESFFEDLCEEVKVHTTYAAKDPQLCFRDGSNLALMDEWQPQLLEALQTSATMVCVTSPAYFGSRFCGQEFYIFDQRRKALRNNPPPPVILPVIWVPDPAGRRDLLDLVQRQQGDIDPLYQSRGLRYLMKINPNEYARCVTLFGYAIA